MPCDSPKRILRGCRLATITVSRPFEHLRVVGRLDAGEHLARFAADVELQLEQLVRAFDVLGVDDARDAQLDLHEVVDRDQSALRSGRSLSALRGRGLG